MAKYLKQVWVDPATAAAHTGLSKHTLKKRRLDGTLVRGWHWTAIGSRCVRYHLDRLDAWVGGDRRKGRGRG